MQGPIVEMRSIYKAFPGVQALADCSPEVMPGEVHALLGENGAGKSTLMKVLTGIYQADSGEIHFAGEKVSINSVLDAREYGIAMIHQELNLMTNLTVAQNIFIGRESKRYKLFLDEKEVTSRAGELLHKLGLDIDSDTMVSELTVAQQQIVEIAKAVSFNSRVIIMDEPTAPLSSSEIDNLLQLSRICKKRY